MNTQTQETGRKLSALQAMAENYGRKFETDLLRFWMRLLQTYSADAVEAAALAIVESRPYPTMPTFAEFRRYLSGMKALTAEDADKVKARQRLRSSAPWEAGRPSARPGRKLTGSGRNVTSALSGSSTRAMSLCSGMEPRAWSVVLHSAHRMQLLLLRVLSLPASAPSVMARAGSQPGVRGSM